MRLWLKPFVNSLTHANRIDYVQEFQCDCVYNPFFNSLRYANWLYTGVMIMGKHSGPQLCWFQSTSSMCLGVEWFFWQLFHNYIIELISYKYDVQYIFIATKPLTTEKQEQFLDLFGITLWFPHYNLWQVCVLFPYVV